MNLSKETGPLARLLTLAGAAVCLSLVLAPSARALTTAEPAGLGTLIIEAEASREFYAPRVSHYLARFSYGISQQLDLRVVTGAHSRDNYSGFLFGGGVKYLIEMETEYFPGLSLVIEAQRANFGVNYQTSSGLMRSGWEEVFNTSTVLIASKRFGGLNPYFLIGVNTYDLDLVDASNNRPVADKSGQSAGLTAGLGIGYEIIRSVLIMVQADYDAAGPLGVGGFTGQAGLNVII